LKSILKIWRSLSISFIRWADKVPMPFLDGMTLWEVISVFIKSIFQGSLSSRAASLSFSFFMALFPGLLFFFTIIPYIPVDNLQEQIFILLKDILPPTSYEAALSTIEDIVNNPNSGLLSFGFIAAMLFATNGTNALLSSFGQTVHNLENVSFWKQYIYSFLLTLVFSVVFVISISALTLSESVLNYFVNKGLLNVDVATIILDSRWVLLLLILLLSTSFLYFLSPLRGKQWGFLSPGAYLATLLVIISSWLFGYYVENFSTYNKLYGSIGTLMVILLWIYLNAFVLLIGFELNMSISVAKKRHLS
jgi:membrane protein